MRYLHILKREREREGRHPGVQDLSFPHNIFTIMVEVLFNEGLLII